MPVSSMDCKNCGSPINPDEKECKNCGEPVSTEKSVNATQEEPKRGKVKYWLIGAASFLFAVGIVIAVFFADIAAWAERVVLSPEMLMKKAVAAAAQDIGSNILAGDNRPNTSRYTASLYVDELLEQLLFEENENDNWLSDMKLQIASGKNDNLMRTQVSFLLKDHSAFSLDVIRDEDTLWLGVPELSNAYLEYRQEDLNWGQAGSLMGKMPSRKDMMQVIYTYGSLMAESARRVTKENATLIIDGVSQDVLQLTATIRQETLKEMGERLKKDTAVQELLSQLPGQWTNLYEALVHSLETPNVDGDPELVAYLDRYNKLIGLELEDGNGKTILYCANANSDGEFASLLTAGDIMLSGNGTCVDGKQTGEYRLTEGEKTILTCKLKDFSLNKKGFSGSVIFPLPMDFAGAMGAAFSGASLELHQESMSGEEVISVNFAVGEKPLIGLKLAEEKAGDFPVEVPSTVISARKQENIEWWLQNLDWSLFVQRLNDAGVPVEQIGNLLP